jgi:hypothetical protein
MENNLVMRLSFKKEETMRYVIIYFGSFLVAISNSFAQKTYDLNTVTVSDQKRVDTVFGTWKYSVADFEFMDDKLLLLTFGRNLEHAAVRLVDVSQKVLSSVDLPDEAQKLYKDYLGFINVMCVNHIYRITMVEGELHLASIPMDEYNQVIVPCIDTIEKDIYFSNYQKDYPEFTYYAYNQENKTAAAIRTVSDKEVMKGYNMEYYFLKPKDTE